jgi:hypothetical protein
MRQEEPSIDRNATGESRAVSHHGTGPERRDDGGSMLTNRTLDRKDRSEDVQARRDSRCTPRFRLAGQTSLVLFRRDDEPTRWVGQRGTSNGDPVIAFLSHPCSNCSGEKKGKDND